MDGRMPLMLALLVGTFVDPAMVSGAISLDATERVLRQCLARPENASTAAQVECQAAAGKAYDRRMNLAYAALRRRLSAPAAEKLRSAQRAWLRFRDANSEAGRALFATRQGTIYLPIFAAREAEVVRDRAMALESQLRIVSADD
jgi:uncharacterized protein YecT (DUF1311 family)